MPPRKTELRIRIEKVLADGQEHDITEIWSRACNGTTVLPGVAARMVESKRRSQTPDSERTRNLNRRSYHVQWSGERILVQQCLNSMVQSGAAVRTGRGVYRACRGIIDNPPASNGAEP